MTLNRCPCYGFVLTEYDDQIVGLCVQHTPPECTKFGGIDNLERVGRLLGKGEGGIHLGKECSVISISALGEKPHHAFPVLVFSSCKAPNPEQQQLALTTVSVFAHTFMVEYDVFYMFDGSISNTCVYFVFMPRASVQILDFWNTDPRFRDTIGPIAVFASDGDAMRRGMLHKLAAAVPSVDSSTLHELALMDQGTSVHGAVQCYDPKHNLKRFRSRDYTGTGVKIAKDGHALNRDSLVRLFRIYDGDPEEKYQTLFSPDDKCVFYGTSRYIAVDDWLPRAHAVRVGTTPNGIWQRGFDVQQRGSHMRSYVLLP